jgi:hypothetical protein
MVCTGDSASLLASSGIAVTPDRAIAVGSDSGSTTGGAGSPSSTGGTPGNDDDVVTRRTWQGRFMVKIKRQ